MTLNVATIPNVRFTCDDQEVARLTNIPADAAFFLDVYERNGFEIRGAVYRPYGTRQEGADVFVLLERCDTLAPAVRL